MLLTPSLLQMERHAFIETMSIKTTCAVVKRHELLLGPYGLNISYQRKRGRERKSSKTEAKDESKDDVDK
ncbi:hypothetical protein PoHVEF18_002784 [Penicillium ochrochloron]